MAKSFDAELAEIEALREQDVSATEAPLRQALRYRNNFIVAKAAKLAADHGHAGLVPELVAAFARFMKEPGKTDPQCWAKNAIVKTLSGFEYQEPDLFLAGMHHVQMEPVWGGTADSAGTLRGASAMALVQCRGLGNPRLLMELATLFADKELAVRVNAARAVEQIGTDAAALMLRLRAELASDDPELLGACYTGVLRLEGPSAIDWAAKFLRPLAPDAASGEAAFAIAETRSAAAFETLHAAWKRARDADFRGSLLTAIALTRQDAAYEFLLREMADGSRGARVAIEESAPPDEVLERLRQVVTEVG